MISAIDTNILIDIFGADPKFGSDSAKLVRQCIQEGTLHACEVVWTETAAVFQANKPFLQSMETLGVEFSAINKETSFIAAKAWQMYRQAGGKRERVVADFLIGAHALSQCERLITRDRGFYRRYFSSLVILDPSAASSYISS